MSRRRGGGVRIVMDGRRGKRTEDGVQTEREREHIVNPLSSQREECVKPDDERLFLERR